MNPSAKPPISWSHTLVFSLTFLTAVIAVPLWGWFVGFDWIQVVLFAVMMVYTGISITGGYHRLWAHNTYEAHPILQVFYAVGGATAIENSILEWAAGHRVHHRHVDDVDLDPYCAKRGLWFSHIGWMLHKHPSGEVDFSVAPDLQRNRIVMWQHRNYMSLLLVMNVGLPILVGYFHGDIIGCFLLMSVLRLVLTHHSTFFINSLAHYWGRQPYSDTNTARDNDVLALLTYGEGYHNFHHMFQTDYRNGIRWWQFDPTKWFIKSCSWVGLTRKLKRVSDFKIQRALIAQQFRVARQRWEKSNKTEALKERLDQEYREFTANVTSWSALKQEWYAQQKQKLSDKWVGTDFSARFKDLETQLKQQRKRMQLLTAQIA